MFTADLAGLYWGIVSLILAAGCTSQNCVLPEHPANGKHMPFEADCPPSKSNTPACLSVPGTSVPDEWFLYTKCNEGFILNNGERGRSQTTCTEGRWQPAPPSCVYNFTNDRKRCIAPSKPKNGNYEPLPIECALNNATSVDLLTPGASVVSSCVLLYSCDEGYQLLDEDVISICVDGQWNPKGITCKGSDDDTRTLTSSSREPCIIPSQSEHRRYCSFLCPECVSYYGSECWYKPGSAVTESVIKVQCNQGYRLPGDTDYLPIGCVNGNWNSAFPQCLKQCPALESDSMYIQCLYGTTSVDCTKPMLPTTTVTYQCKPSHKEFPNLLAKGFYSRTLTCKYDGKWTYTLPECEPVCGISKAGVVISPTIVNGYDAPLGAFPWHTGLYLHTQGSWTCICGGSLITNRIVLTAAHCVSMFNASELRVALGKFYRSWTHHEETAVKRNVSAVRIPEEYNGSVTSYAWDIALLLLSKKVEINSYVMPVCRDINLDLKMTQSNVGYVVGWGKTVENGKESEILLHNDLSVIDYSLCLRKIPKILGFDKFCGAKGSASVAEKGDSGGGVTTIFNDQHYVIGIVSVKIENLSVFTNVSWPTHKRWLDNKIFDFDRN